MSAPGSFETLHARALAALRSLEIAEWSLTLEESESLSVGAKDRKIGGVYAPPRVTRELSGNLYVLWKEPISGVAAVSRTRVDGAWLADPAAGLRALRGRAYPETFVIDLPGERAVPDVAVYDEEVARIVRRDAGYAFEALAQLKPRLTRARDSYTADFSASVTRYRVTNSKGLDREVRQTQSGFGAEADSVFGVAAGERRLVPLERIAARLDRLNEWLPHFEKTETPRTPERAPIVLLPDAAASFLAHFVLANLDGEAIANGQSAWKPGDFSERRQVFSDRLTIAFDPLEDWRPWSYRLDRRGLPSERRAYVQGGRLASPVVSLKAAKQLSCAPSPVPSSSGLSIEAAGAVELDRHLASLERGVVVTSVLGMHTQDAARGNYSLSVPHALLVRDGKVRGAGKAVLSGNFFEDLSGDTLAVASPADDSAGLGFEGTVKFT